MKRLFLVLSAALLTGFTSYAQSPNTQTPLRLTLEQSLEYAMTGNYTRQSVLLNETSQEISAEQAKLERMPGVSANLSESVSNTQAGGTGWSGNYDVSANVILFQGGQINNTIRQNELQYEQTKLRTQQYDNELAIQILQSFLTAIGNEELLRYQQSILQTSEQQAAEGRIRYQAGQILESDYLLLEAQYATDKNNITATQVNRDNSLVALKNLMGIDLLQPVELIYPDDAAIQSMLELPSEQQVVSQGLESLPDVGIVNYSVEIAETGLKVTRGSLYPTISLSAGIGTGHLQNFDNFGTQIRDRFGPQAGISVSIPIFNRGRARSNVKQSEVALQQAELERQQTILNIEQTLINEYGNVVSSASKYQAAEITQNAYQKSFEAYTEMFKAGAITTVELLQQQNNYITTMNDYIQSKYTFMLQRKVLDVYMGQVISM